MGQGSVRWMVGECSWVCPGGRCGGRRVFPWSMWGCGRWIGSRIVASSGGGAGGRCNEKGMWTSLFKRIVHVCILILL